MLFDLQRAVQSALQTVIGRELELDDEFPLVAVRHESHADPGRQISHRNEEKRRRQQHGRKPVAADEIDRNGRTAARSAPNPRFHHRNRKASEFCSGSSARSRIAARIGVSVKLTKSDTSVAMPIVTANGTRKRPTSEPIIAIGPNTTTFVMADAENRQSDFGRAAVGRRLRVLAAFKVSGDILDDDDRVGHQRADRGAERKQREDVEREAAKVHRPERNDDRNRHRYDDDEG